MIYKSLCRSLKSNLIMKLLSKMEHYSALRQPNSFFHGTAFNMTSITDYKTASSIYDFTVKDSFDNDVKLDKYKGNVVMVVNIASKCGLAKTNYTQLTELNKKYNDSGLRILSFPCNQFASQSPEKDGEEMICHLKDVKADVGDVMKKVDVNGDNAEPLYKYLKSKQGGTLTDAIKWNFTKFLIDKNGQPVDRFAPTKNPIDISSKIENLLRNDDQNVVK